LGDPQRGAKGLPTALNCQFRILKEVNAKKA
jgi:hypothetical protein